jgi:MarR family 2-MHQ and catechol resistance regulon transcriptional repressor
MDEIFPQHEKAMGAIFSSLSIEEKETAIALIKKLGLFADSL